MKPLSFLTLMLVALALPAAQQSDTTRNPLGDNPAAIAEGQRLYDQTCQSCHAPAGRGDRGPALDTGTFTRGNEDGDLFHTIREGIRYASQAPALRAVLVRTGVFVPFASALWALLPLLAYYELELNCFGYGTLFGFLGVGSVIGAIFLPKLQRHFSTDALVVGATITFAATTAALAEVRHFGLVCLVMITGGIAWVTVMSSFNVAIQIAVPSWIRARALALYLLVFHGGMAAGSVLWGAVTQHAGVAVALFGAAGGMLVSLVAMAWYPLEESEQSDLTPSAYRLDRAAERTPRVSISAGPVPAVASNYRYAPRHQEYRMTAKRVSN